MDNEMRELKDQELQEVSGGEQETWDAGDGDNEWVNGGCVKVRAESGCITVYANSNVTRLKIYDFLNRDIVLASCGSLMKGQTWTAPVMMDPGRTYALSVNYSSLNGDLHTQKVLINP